MVEKPIPNNLSISTYMRKEIHTKTEFNLYKHKDEEECKKCKNFKNEYFFNINVDFSFGPILVK